jgi:hypothetical protein
MVAVMARISPFAERAGMQRVLEQKPTKEALQVANAVSDLGFDLKLLGSQKHVLGKLQNLSSTQVEALKEVFIRNDHPRFKKEFGANRHMPYGTSAAYVEGIRNASMERMAKLFKIVGMLLQTKIYLFWRKTLEP